MIVWHEFQDGKSINATGVDGGVIIKDEESSDARITLEKGSAIGPYSISCGLYGIMAHSFPVADSLAGKTYEKVKKDLEKLIELWPKPEDSQENKNKFYEALEQFTKEYS